MSVARGCLGASVALLLVLTVAPKAGAAPGDLDPQFGDNGIVRVPTETPTCRFPESIQDIGLGAAGILAGDYNGLLRLGPSGEINARFGHEGSQPAGCPVGRGVGAIAEQGSRLIAFGHTIDRLSRGGTGDSSFGRHGVAHFAGEYFADGAVDIDERIVAAGVDRFVHASPVFERFLPDGRRDPSFGFDGIARLRTPFNGGATIAAVAVQPDGGVIGVGQATSRRGEYEAYIVRLRPDGVRDRHFGKAGNGVVQIHLGEYSLGIAVGVQEGRIYVLATTEDVLSGSEVIIASLRPDGRFDRSFGRHGLVRHRVFDMQPTDMALYHGMPIVSGWAGRRHGASMVLTRFTKQGRIDRLFGRNGVVRTAIGKEAFGETVAVQRNGDILIGGVANVGKDGAPILARYLGGENRR